DPRVVSLHRHCLHHLCTLYRRKRREAEDRELLERMRGTPRGNPGDPCVICTHPRRLDTGHAHYQGVSYCAMEGGESAQRWLAGRKGRLSPPSRTTLWRKRKREKEEEAKGRPEGAKTRKTNKLRRYRFIFPTGSPEQDDGAAGRDVLGVPVP
ncbi:unnamed protein product, partial [Lota lota]